MSNQLRNTEDRFSHDVVQMLNAYFVSGHFFFLIEKHENHLNFPKKHKKMPKKFREGFANIHVSLYNYGLLYEKTVFLHMCKQKCRSAAQNCAADQHHCFRYID